MLHKVDDLFQAISLDTGNFDLNLFALILILVVVIVVVAGGILDEFGQLGGPEGDFEFLLVAVFVGHRLE